MEATGERICTEYILLLNPFKPSGISHSYQLDQSIIVLRIILVIFFIFIRILIELSVKPQLHIHDSGYDSSRFVPM